MNHELLELVKDVLTNNLQRRPTRRIFREKDGFTVLTHRRGVNVSANYEYLVEFRERGRHVQVRSGWGFGYRIFEEGRRSHTISGNYVREGMRARQYLGIARKQLAEWSRKRRKMLAGVS